MPYGQNRNRRSYRTNYRKSTTGKKRRPKTAVAKIQRKKYVPKVVKNTMSVLTLARQVKRLQQSQLGLIQRHALTYQWNKAEELQYPFNSCKPMCFCTNQFVDLNKGNGTRQNPSMYMANEVGQGYKQTVFSNWDMTCWNEALNPHWADQDDQVSMEAYKPLGTSMKFEFAFNNLSPGERTRWCRIDIIRPKKVVREGQLHLLKLPFGLGQFEKLTDNYMLYRNFINKLYWDVIHTKWIPVVNNTNTVTKGFTKVVTINRSFKNDPIFRTDLNAMDPIGGSWADFQDNVPYNQTEWCVISCDLVPDRVSILKKDVWRDQAGTSA